MGGSSLSRALTNYVHPFYVSSYLLFLGTEHKRMATKTITSQQIFMANTMFHLLYNFNMKEPYILLDKNDRNQARSMEKSQTDVPSNTQLPQWRVTSIFNTHVHLF